MSEAHSPGRGETVGWEEYRKRARKLEGELDMKLSNFSKLCAKYDGPSGSSSLVEETLDEKGNELDRLLQTLESLNGSMQSVMPQTDGHAHTLSRHQDILREYVQERDRLKNSISRSRHRTEALNIGSETTPLMGLQVQGSAGTLLRERATLHSASAGIDEVIHQATAISEDMKMQGTMLGKMSSRLMEVTAKYPALHGLLRSIGRRKSRDVIILGCVIASCLALMIAYVAWR